MLDISSLQPTKAESPLTTLRTSTDEFSSVLADVSAKPETAPHAKEPTGPPPKEPCPPPGNNARRAEATGEVKPNEPNARENEPDFQTNASQTELGAHLDPTAQAVFAHLQLATQPPAVQSQALENNPANSGSTLPGQQIVGNFEADPRTVASGKVPGPAITHDVVAAQQLPSDPSVRIVSVASTETAPCTAVNSLAGNAILPKSDKASPSAVVHANSEAVAMTVELNTATSGEGANSQGEHSAPHSHGQPQDEDSVSGAIPTQAAPNAPAFTAGKVEAPPEITTAQRNLIMRQVADRIELLSAGRSKDGIIVHLQPADLGAITVVLHGDRTDLQARLYSENDRVRTALQQAHPDLVKHLGQRGVTLSSLAVSTHNSSSSASSNTDPGRSNRHLPQESPRPHSGHSSSTFGLATATAAPVSLSRSQAGIDLSI